MKRLAVVPARGGSKRIPNKNIRDFCGRPMIAHVLAAARDSGLFETIHVSTESDSIRSVAEELGFPPDFPAPIVYQAIIRQLCRSSSMCLRNI